MAESNPASGAIWLDNFVTNGTTTINSTSSNSAYSVYSLDRQLEPRRSRATWFDNSTPAETLICFDMGAGGVTPECLALISSNIATGQSLRLWASDDVSMASGLVKWNFTTYPQADPHDVMKFYLGAADEGTFSSPLRYWQVRMNEATADYIKVGSIYIGTYEAVRMSPITDTLRDPSVVKFSDGGAPYIDKLPWYTQFTMQCAVLSRPDAYALRAAIVAGGTQHVIADVHANNTNDDTRPYSARYCLTGKGSPLTNAMRSVTNNSVALKLMETRG